MSGIVDREIDLLKILGALLAVCVFVAVLFVKTIRMVLAGTTVIAVVLSIGGLVGWGVSKIVRMSVLSSMDRFFGSVFGAGRGVLLVALAVMGGQLAGFNGDDWWRDSRLIPHLEVVADWIAVMAPKGFELLMPGEVAV